MIKIVSTALFGDAHTNYAKYVPAFIRGALNIFPIRDNWRIRFCVDSQVASGETGALIRRYAHEGLCESVIMYTSTKASPPLCWGMMWRLAAVFEPNVEYVFSRDLDAPPMPRDRACCDRFIQSKATMHTIHDHEQHMGIMGGLCGVWAPDFLLRTGLRRLEDLRALADTTIGHAATGRLDWSRKGADQAALNTLLVARPQLTLLEHRYKGREPGLYPCEAWSTQTPSVLDDSIEKAMADSLGAHLGCAGYDIDAAVQFWDEHGDVRITDALHACEADRSATINKER
jgi:hypothetical protein